MTEWRVVTDRPCGLEVMARAHEARAKRIEERDNALFSDQAAKWLVGEGCCLVLMFFSRLVTDALYRRVPALNVHPSLLPAFRGFGPVEATRQAGARFLGATLHVAGDEPDGGPIVAQCCCPLSPGEADPLLQRKSYLQKAYLAALAVDLVASEDVCLSPGGCPEWRTDRPATPGCSPMLQPDLHHAFLDHQRRLGVDALA
jgi:phosphoribosylglycinamide formyltransferase-1